MRPYAACVIALFFARKERAITETAEKYGGYCAAIAGRMLPSREDDVMFALAGK